MGGLGIVIVLAVVIGTMVAAMFMYTQYQTNYISTVAGETITVGAYDNGVKTGKWLFWANDILKEVEYNENIIAAVNESKNTDIGGTSPSISFHNHNISNSIKKFFTNDLKSPASFTTFLILSMAV